MNHDYYNDGKFSIKALCNAFIAENDPTAEMFNFDTHATLNNLPDKTLIGPAEYSIDQFDRTYVITTMIGFCTDADDTLLEKLDTLVGKMFSQLNPGNTFPLYDFEGRLQHGKLTVMDNLKVMPIARNNDNRPFIGIGVRFAMGVVALP